MRVVVCTPDGAVFASPRYPVYVARVVAAVARLFGCRVVLAAY